MPLEVLILKGLRLHQNCAELDDKGFIETCLRTPSGGEILRENGMQRRRVVDHKHGRE